MSSFQDMTRAVTCRFNDKIKKFCLPLFDLFNLSHFGYCKTTNNGSFAYLGSHVEWSEYFAAEKLYLNFPYYRHPKFLTNGVTLMKESRDRAYLDTLNLARDKFNIHHRLLILNKIPDGIEGFCFAVNSYEEEKILLLIDNLHILRLFIKRFRVDCRFLFSLLEENQVDLVDLIGLAFHQNIIPISPQRTATWNFLQKMGIEVGKPLTSREIDVIKLLLQGYSAGKIALKIYLSKRTVEHHIERIKEKLSCYSKAELIQKARELEQFGYLVP